MGTTNLIDSDFLGFEIRFDYDNEDYTGKRFLPLKEGQIIRKTEICFVGSKVSEVKNDIERFIKLENCFKALEENIEILRKELLR